jgi:hypothetical protein
MDSPFLSRIILFLVVIALIPGAALAISSRAEKPPCPCNLGGYVVSWSCIWEATDPVYPYKLPNVEVQVRDCMGGSAKAVTDEKGYFEFPCVPNPTPGCGFCFKITGVDIAGYVTAFDASLILRYLVNLQTLDKCPYETAKGVMYPQMVAADVNCQNGINAYDAALILMYTVGTIDHFDCGEDWVWYPSPSCATECTDAATLYCICIGDVSGPSSGPSFFKATTPAVVKIGTPSHYSSFVKVPVLVSGAEDVYGAEFAMAYNPADFEVIDVKPGELTTGFMSDYNPEGGLLQVALAGAQPFSGDGEIAVITLEKKRPLINTVLSRLLISDALLNEDVPVIEDSSPGSPEIFKLSLGPISPNPSAGSTAISFTISSAATVSLSIYNVEGELVRSLFAGEAQAGPNQVAWDGTDAQGNRVGRGIYFCRMNAGNLTATEKIVFIK